MIADLSQPWTSDCTCTDLIVQCMRGHVSTGPRDQLPAISSQEYPALHAKGSPHVRATRHKTPEPRSQHRSDVVNTPGASRDATTAIKAPEANVPPGRPCHCDPTFSHPAGTALLHRSGTHTLSGFWVAFLRCSAVTQAAAKSDGGAMP